MIEFAIFFDLCKRYRRDDVEQVYIAIQAAISYGAKLVDVGPKLGQIRPPGYRGLDDGYDPGIGVSGLAFFHWIYDTKILKEGGTDYHTYRFIRRHDQKQIQVTLKTTNEPSDPDALSEYEEQVAKLSKSRNSLLVTKRYGTLSEDLFGI